MAARPGVEPEFEGVEVEWPAPGRRPYLYEIVETLEAGLGAVTRLRLSDAEQPFKNMVVGAVKRGTRRCRIAIDYADLSSRIEPAALSEVDLYFKLQYRRGGYGEPRILPGGFVPGGRDFYRYLPALRGLAIHPRRRAVFARFGFRFQAEFRKQVLRLLGDARGLEFVGATGKVRYSRFLREAAQSQLAVDLPGNGAFCHRLVEFLGMGTCVIGLRHANEMHVPLVPGIHYIAFKEDCSDLVELCEHHVQHPEERDRIAAAGREYFEQNLEAPRLARYFLRRSLAVLA